MTPSRSRGPVDAARLRLALVRVARRLRQEAGDGSTPSQLSALATLDRRGPMSLGDLAEAERVGPSTLTRVISALEERGLVERAPDPADRRVALVRTTAAGRRLLRAARDRGTRLLAERLDRLEPSDAEVLAAALPVLEALAGDDA